MIVIVVKQPVRAKYAARLARRSWMSSRRRLAPNRATFSFDWYRSAEDTNLWVLIEVFRDEEAGQSPRPAIRSTSRGGASFDDAPLARPPCRRSLHVEVPGDRLVSRELHRREQAVEATPARVRPGATGATTTSSGRINLITPEKVLEGVRGGRGRRQLRLSLPLDYPRR